MMKPNFGAFEYIVVISATSYVIGLLFLLLNRLTLF